MNRFELPSHIDDKFGPEHFPIAAETKNVTFDCGRVYLISSLGIIGMIKIFEQLRERGLKITFENCNAVLMNTAAMMSKDFMQPAEVVSMKLPFFCETCEESYSVTAVTKDLLQTDFDLAPYRAQVICKDDNCEIEFDDVEDTFFMILGK
jgi:hypothetical protein